MRTNNFKQSLTGFLRNSPKSVALMGVHTLQSEARLDYNQGLKIVTLKNPKY